jgi:hypothetical protein
MTSSMTSLYSPANALLLLFCGCVVAACWGKGHGAAPLSEKHCIRSCPLRRGWLQPRAPHESLALPIGARYGRCGVTRAALC